MSDTQPQPLTASRYPSDRHSRVSFSCDNAYISTVQIHSLHDADEETKRQAVYLQPTALLSSGLDILLADYAHITSFTDDSSAGIQARADATVARLRKREILLHLDVRTSLFAEDDANPTLVDAYQSDSQATFFGDGDSALQASETQHRYTSDERIGAGTFVQDVGNVGPPQAQYATVTRNERKRARAEATYSCIMAGSIIDIPCGRAGCNAILADIQALIAHVHIHDIEGHIITYECIGCMLRFQDKADAKEHRRSCEWVTQNCSISPPRQFSGAMRKVVGKVLRVTDLWK